LKEWQTLYVSGRMHKPIKIIKADKVGTEAALRISRDRGSRFAHPSVQGGSYSCFLFAGY